MPMEQPALLVLRVPPVLLVQREPQVLLAHKAQLELMD